MADGQGADSPAAAVVILNWNAGEHLARCAASVAATVPQGTRVVLVDNGSTDGSLEAAALTAPSAEIVRNGENLGWAVAHNRVMLQAPERYIVVLAPDTVVDRKGWLEDLVAVAEGNPQVAAVAAKLVFAHDPTRVNSAGAMAYWFTGPVDVGFGEPDGPEVGVRSPPFAASGGCMLVRRSAFAERGGFDEKMFVFIEDVDLCWRLRLVGSEVAFAPHVVIKHVFSSTVGPLSARKVYWTHRNWLRSMLKNYSARTLVGALPAYLAWTALKVAGALAAERSPRLAAQPLRALGWNAALLNDTLRERRRIQANRRISDRRIRALMGPRPFEPLQSLLRRKRVAQDKQRGGRP